MSNKEVARQNLEAVFDDLRVLNRWMYEHPEVAYEERSASAKLVELLSPYGFEIEYPAYGLDTAFAARAGAEGPEIIICAEYDALPGIGHACGHNIIATAALGAGIALAPLCSALGVRVTVLGTPAEEKYGGKVDLIKAGAFKGATAAMMVHPAPEDVVDPNIIAVAHIDVHYHGKEAHASAYPQLGRNALDAFVQAYVNISTLRQHLYPTDKVHGIITHGGEAPNVIPAYTRSSWYVRAQTADRLEELLGRVRGCFEAAATATGCSFEIEHVGHTYEELIPNAVMAAVYESNSRALGRPMKRRGDLPASETGSTDMGNVSQVIPSIHPMLNIGTSAVNHQPEFADATVTPDGEKAIFDGALTMAWTTIELAERELWEELSG